MLTHFKIISVETIFTFFVIGGDRISGKISAGEGI
jgi:hypothetical protein